MQPTIRPRVMAEYRVFLEYQDRVKLFAEVCTEPFERSFKF